MNYRWVMWTVCLAALALIVVVGRIIMVQTYLMVSGGAPQLVPVTWAVSEPWKTAGFYWVVSFCLTLIYLSWHYREELYIGGKAGPGTRPFTYGILGTAAVGYLLCLILAAATQAFPPGMGGMNRWFSTPLIRLLTTLSGDRLAGVAGAFSAMVWFVLLAVVFGLIAGTFYRLIEHYETAMEPEEEGESD